MSDNEDFDFESALGGLAVGEPEDATTRRMNPSSMKPSSMKPSSMNPSPHL